ncbi:MAG: hypothetical protein M1472_04905, partial [Planctomycetes bacterium]|nr:hypothetical protein [Planctomycetota bacterium]
SFTPYIYFIITANTILRQHSYENLITTDIRFLWRAIPALRRQAVSALDILILRPTIAWCFVTAEC